MKRELAVIVCAFMLLASVPVFLTPGEAVSAGENDLLKSVLPSIQEKKFLSMMAVSLWDRPVLVEDGICPAILSRGLYNKFRTTPAVSPANSSSDR